jgi:hypothetical protein
MPSAVHGLVLVSLHPILQNLEICSTLCLACLIAQGIKIAVSCGKYHVVTSEINSTSEKLHSLCYIF